MTAPLLEVTGLSVDLLGRGASAALLDDVSFAIARGESVGVVGASGAGKSSLASAILRILPRAATVRAGSSVRLDGEELLALDEQAMRERRGRRLAMVFQEPLEALDPSMPVADQVAEGLIVHGLASVAEARERAIEMLDRIGIPGARHAGHRLPHEFSGGMRQRIVIAGALIMGPDLLVADEPTTALDPTIQAQVLDLLGDLRAATGSALLLISHDLDVVAERCDRVLVLERGRLVEAGSASAVANAPTSDAGKRLAAARRLRGAYATKSGATAPLLEVRELRVEYRGRRRVERGAMVRAVAGVSFTVGAGESVGLVGESGCGKTSVAHALVRVAVAEGVARLGDTDLLGVEGETLRRIRQRIQLVPQDAGASLTPHLSGGELVREGLEVHGLAVGPEAERRTRMLLAEVDLPDRAYSALPRELSAGERQRVAIARALATSPGLLVCDEPVASVDAPTRAKLLELLDRLRRERGLALLFISHDLAAVERLTSRLLVMYLGRIVESGPTAEVLARPRMPYTQALLSAVPTGDPAHARKRTRIAGEPPSPLAPPPGCAFFPRCPHPQRDAACQAAIPAARELAPGHAVACIKA